jgi:hypothetical protein
LAEQAVKFAKFSGMAADELGMRSLHCRSAGEFTLGAIGRF